MKSDSRKRPSNSFRQGATTVEFALVLPILLVLVFGSMEFTRVNQVSNAAAFAAYQACRQAIITGGNATAAQTAAQNVLNTMSIGTSTITITPSVITSQTDAVTATVTVPMNNAAWISPMFTGGQIITRGCTLTCQCVTPEIVSVPQIVPVYTPPASQTWTGTFLGTQYSFTGTEVDFNNYLLGLLNAYNAAQAAATTAATSTTSSSTTSTTPTTTPPGA
jgi:Flp pilus assembly protein TadG